MPALREGEVSSSVIPISIANLDFDEETGSYQFPDYARVARFRAALEAQAGIPAATILKELEASLPVRRVVQDGHSPRLREQPPPQPPVPAPAAGNSHEDTAPAQSPRQRRRRIS